MQTFFLFILCMTVGAITYYYAKQRGRNPQLWFVLGFLFGILGLLALFLLPSKNTVTQPKVVIPHPDELQPKPFFQKSLLETLDPTHSSKLWYYLDTSNQQFGPMSLNALSSAWEDGKVNSQTYVWNEELANWQRFEEVLKPLPT